jgi:hypothetical protein
MAFNDSRWEGRRGVVSLIGDFLAKNGSRSRKLDASLAFFGFGEAERPFFLQRGGGRSGAPFDRSLQ